MLDDTLDPRPQPESFACLIAERAAEHGHTAADLAHWLRGWHDREGAWTNLRNIEHWMERAGA
jgi:hypothetical protein